MKKLLIFLLLCSSAATYAQTVIPISSFLGMKFGTTPEEAIQQMTAAKATYDPKQSKKGNFVFKNAEYGGIKTDHAYFRYDQNKMVEGGAFFPTDRQQVLVMYSRVKRIIATAYGEGTDARSFTNGYVDGDGRELEAIENSNGSITTTWVEDPQKNIFNTIVLSIEPDLSVLVRFMDVKTAGKNKR